MPSKDSSARPAHRRTISSKSYFSTRTPDIYTPSPSELVQYTYLDVASANTATKTSRIMTSVRRSIGSIPKKRGPESLKSSSYGLISTPAERNPSTYARHRNYSSPRPSIEQIAMGLHTSRTPHLRPLSASPTHFSPSSRSASPLVLPPAPTRSSLKQPNSADSRSPMLVESTPASASSSTVTSSHPPTPKPTPNSITSIRLRMARLFPRSRNTSAPPSVLSSSATSSPRPSVDFQAPKKAVRFSTQVEPVSSNGNP